MCHDVTDDGISPACAGSTRCSLTRCSARWDHPRMRGEHQNGDVYNITDVGSSPHARGAPRPCDRRGRRDGIIPACAGSTSTGCPARCRGRDHPRMRGEHPEARALVRVVHGIIPACAGNTDRAEDGIGGSGDHPRMRGEHIPKYTFTISFMGSSPHARGALNGFWCQRYSAGIIPACAGNTYRSSKRASSAWDHPRMRGEHMRSA